MSPNFAVIMFVVVLCCSLISGSDVFGKKTASGKFMYKGDQCKWSEKRETRSMRSLNIQCGGRNPFSTAYEADPHKCNWYLKGNQEKYYECLVAALMKANFCKNSPSQVACDKKGCGDVIFKKMKTENHLHSMIIETLNVKKMITDEEDADDLFEFDFLNNGH